MSRELRKELIKKIEDKRGSKVIAYVTSDRPNLSVSIADDVISLIHKHILSLEDDNIEKIDLFIYSRGGQSDVPWAIVSMIREYCSKSFGVLIPYRAHSAATVIALGADEIIMTKKAELGPIDITMGDGPYNPVENNSLHKLPISVEDVTGYFSLLEKVGCERPEEKMKGFELLTNYVHPLALGKVSRLLEETKLVGLRLLNTRTTSFGEQKNQEIIQRLSSEVYSHSHAISRTEARKYIGLDQVKDAEDYDIAEELWDLYLEYNKLFEFDNIFSPEEYLISNGLEYHTWENLNLACVESLNRFDICKQDVKASKIKSIPPSITFNLDTINFPPISIGSLSTRINQKDIEALIQNTVSEVIERTIHEAINLATERFIESLPSKEIQLYALNAGWERNDEYDN